MSTLAALHSVRKQQQHSPPRRGLRGGQTIERQQHAVPERGLLRILKAIHHRGGMQASGTIVTVNTDPGAPIFEISDFGVVGDLATVLPQAIAAIKKHRGL